MVHLPPSSAPPLTPIRTPTMTTTVTTATGLLEIRDPNLLGFLACWERDRRAPFPLVDYFLDLGWEAQAAAARWVVEKEERRVWAEHRPMAGPFPVYPSANFPHWSWMPILTNLHAQKPGYNYADAVDFMKGDYQTSHPSLNAALVYLLDAYPEELLRP